MDREEIQRLAETYRRMRDEQLAALLAERSTLTDEARQALLAVVAERPSALAIQQLAMDAQSQAERSVRQQAEREVQRKTLEARRQLAWERPALGFWLGLLMVFLGMLSLRRAVLAYAMIRMVGVPYPQLVERDTWLSYSLTSVGVAVTVFIAAGIAIHAICAGNTRGHLWRIVAMLWYVSFGVILVDLAIAGWRTEFAYIWPAISAGPNVIYLTLMLTVVTAWTAYLMRSERCRRRYPRRSEGSVVRTFE
jgi:hypothetical protein